MDTVPRTVQISGDVAYFSVQIAFLDQKDELMAWERIHELEVEMRHEFDRVARDVLGREFRVRSMTIGRGSIEVIIVLAAVGSFYMGFSRYKNFMESLDLLRSQIQSILRRFMPNSDSVSATWIPSPALVSVAENSTPLALQWYTSHQIQMILLIYFIVSHAAILAVLVWLLIRKVT